MGNKLTEKQAQNKLYSLWENGDIPSNFTEDHSEYDIALLNMMKNGYINIEDYGK